MITAILESPSAGRGIAEQSRLDRNRRHARACSLAAFLRSPEALDCDDAELAERFDMPEREVERAWERHFERVDAQMREELSQREAATAQSDNGALTNRVALKPRSNIERLVVHVARVAEDARRRRWHRDPRSRCEWWIAEHRTIRRRHRRLDWTPATAF